MSSIIYYSHKLVLKSSYKLNRQLSDSKLQRKLLVVLLIINALTKCCVGSSVSGLTTSSQSLGSGIFIIRSPESTTAPPGDEVQFECELNLLPEKLEWRFRPQDISTEKDYFVNVHKSPGYNITTKDRTSKLHVYVNQKTVGDYQCVAWFGASAITSISAKLMLATISLDSKEATNTMVRRILPNQMLLWKIAPKNSLIIKCGDVISYPPPVWNYYKDNVQISQTMPQLASGGLIISQLAASDSGTYTCSAVNSITGIDIKIPQKIILNVDMTPRSAPIFLIQPPTLFTVKPNSTILLECPGVANPVPKAVWSRPEGSIDNNRSNIFGYGLQIHHAKPEDQGTYVCQLDNGIFPVLIHKIKLVVLENPVILEGLKSTLTNESDSLELDCKSRGSPIPEINWMINGQDTKWDPSTRAEGSKLFISAVEKKHAGIVQCFAKNEAGAVSDSSLLQVNPKQIPGEIGVFGVPLGTVPQTSKSNNDHHSKPTKGRRKNKRPVMIPPSRPIVTRLKDESVMVRWSVPSNEGLPIQFFKVQYRMLGDEAKKIARSQWKTANEDIPPHVRSYQVDNLKPDNIYKFRIAAVYSNNDNKLSIISSRFHLLSSLKLGPNRSHLAAPVLSNIEPVSETSIAIHWTMPTHLPFPVEGFFVYYRPSTSAGEYSKETVMGHSLRHFKIDHLESGQSYEFKLQSFTALAASNFSAILTGRTLKPPTTTITPSVVAASDASQRPNSFLPMIVGVAVGCTLLFLIFIMIFIALKRRKMAQEEDATESKSHPDTHHIQVEPNGFPNGGGRVLSSPIHKSSRLNGGVLPRMNITSNPLDGEKSDKKMSNSLVIPTNHPSLHQQSALTSQLPPLAPHRRTLERNIRNNHHNQQLNQHAHTNGGMLTDAANGNVGIPVVRNSSIRRQPRRGSNNSNGSPRIMRGPSSELLQHHHQRSPMPIRANNGKPRSRLGRAENMSSGSLNSIEV